MPYIICPECGQGFDNGRGPHCSPRAVRNERDAWQALAETVGSEPAAIIRELVETMADSGAIAVLRGPGETADDRGTFADEPIRPGERIIDGRRYYSAAWL